jgi:predicted MFS family arabinose efflux permease
VIAATGALLFAAGDTLPLLVFARGLIGMGVAACLMAALKAFTLWYPVEQRASLSGWIMTAGGLGALAATAPLEALLHVLPWRGVFVVLAAATLLVAIALYRQLPNAHGTASGWRTQWAGVVSIFRSGRFWWIAPLNGLGMGGFMAIQGLWSVPWLMEVNGLSRPEAARVLFAMSAAQLGGYFSLGITATWLGRRGIRPRHLFAAGFTLHLAVLAAILWQLLPSVSALWIMYGVAVTINVLGYNLLADGFPAAYAGRSSTALNLMTFAGSFLTQWGVGVVVDLVGIYWAYAPAAAFRFAFLLVLAMQVAAWSWFMLGWRRYAHGSPGAN